MNRKLLKKLVIVSYKNGQLDSKTVAEIADRLDREDLKQYIKALKNAEKIRNVYVESPFDLSKTDIKDLEHIFPDKNIIGIKDTSLIIGSKVLYNDDVFEMNLKNSLDSIVENIENYD